MIGMYDEATIRVIASTLKRYYVEKPFRPVCDPVCVSTSGHPLPVENAVGSLVGEMPPLATTITLRKYEAKLILSYKQKVSISNLGNLVSSLHQGESQLPIQKWFC